MGGEDDDLKKLGFLDSDDEIDFSNFKVGGSAEDNESEQKQAQSLFGGLMSTFQNFTGNKVLTSQDLDPVLEQFTNSLTDRNVSVEIAGEICKQVKKSLLNTKTASFTTIKQTIQETLVDAIKTLMAPKKNIDILKEALSAKKKGQVYSMVFIGVNGVGKSTSLAKTAYYLKTKGNLKVMIAGCDNFRSGAIE
jgi:signal recognition particle receptor subunit alpha